MSAPCPWCEAEPCTCKRLARPCALCDLPCVRIGEGEPNALWLDASGHTRVVHSRCKRQRQARAHGSRIRVRTPKGPRLV